LLPSGPSLACLAALFGALRGRVAGGVGFCQRVSDGLDRDIVKVERIAVSGFQRFNREHVPLGDFQEKLVG
jgi:hypothetical protein